MTSDPPVLPRHGLLRRVGDALLRAAPVNGQHLRWLSLAGGGRRRRHPLFVAALYAGLCFSLAAAAAHGVLAATLLSLVFARLGQPFGFELVLFTGVSGAIAVLSNRLAHGRARTEVDPLTAAYNRRGLERVLREAAAHADASTAPLAIALLDLDDFKRHNDLHGHEEGDQILVASVQAWRGLLPPSAALARLGGDESVVVLPDVGLPAARRLLDQWRLAVAGRVHSHRRALRCHPCAGPLGAGRGLSPGADRA